MEEIAAEINDGGLGTAVALSDDIKDETYAQALVALALARFVHLDGAFNNAGIVGEMLPAADMRRGDRSN
ncbi:hypothetical protein VQ042_25425 [Aurantimonas sp. A2-1-M11]|uniref:hypothetical protein n=1 Tax=Aurantimonas sp. A2-1-M11 TaxID=3113712 RepID=UPI002F91E502